MGLLWNTRAPAGWVVQKAPAKAGPQAVQPTPAWAMRRTASGLYRRIGLSSASSYPDLSLSSSASPTPSTLTGQHPLSSSTLSAPSTPLSSPSASAHSAVNPASPSLSPSAKPPVDDFLQDSRPVILYDGVCNLCNAAVDFMLKWDTQGKFRMASLQSDAGRRLLQRCGRAPDDITSIVVVERSRHYIRSDAILRIAQGISNPFPFLALFGYPVPKPLRDILYDQVANNRYSLMGKRTVCRMSNVGFEDRFLVQ